MSHKNKSMSSRPSFQFYPNDWLSSTHIMLMTPEQEGAYIRLLAIEWQSEDCGLPDNDEELSILSRLGEGWFVGSEKIRSCFFVKDGRLFNQRLLDERKKQDDWIKKSEDAGKRSWESRKGKGKMTRKGWFGVGSSVVRQDSEPSAEPKPNSSSSSSSSITTPTPSRGQEEENLKISEAEKKLIAWFGKMRDVTSPEGLAKTYLKLYSPKIILAALANSNCTSRSRFVEICKFKLKESLKTLSK